MLLIVITKLVRSYPELNDLFILLIITNIQKNKKKMRHGQVRGGVTSTSDANNCEPRADCSITSVVLLRKISFPD